jgi:hypothetical protein
MCICGSLLSFQVAAMIKNNPDLFPTKKMKSFLTLKTLDSWKIVLQSHILDFDVEQAYLVQYLLVHKIKEDVMHFLFFFCQVCAGDGGVGASGVSVWHGASIQPGPTP